MKKENKKMKFIIQGHEKNKSEIVYNYLITNMDSLDLSKDKQIEYLKSRINYLETNIKNKVILTSIILLSFIILILGMLFMYLDIFVLGISFSILSFVMIIFLLMKFKNKNTKNEINNEFVEIEVLRNILNSKLK